jgi:hypothetical protein
MEAVKVASCGRVHGKTDWPPDMPAAEKLRHFIHGMLTELLDPQRPEWHSRLMMREMADPTTACTAVVNEFIRPSAVRLQAIVREILPPETGEREIALSCFSIVGQCLFYRVHRPIVIHLVGEAEHAAYDVDRLAEHITKFSLAGLGVKEGKERSPGRRGQAHRGAPS